MNCKPDAVELMHKYFDGDLTKAEESRLVHHVEDCEDCRQHFHELKRTITWIQSADHIEAPANFTQRVMENLPKERNSRKYLRWFKAHPVLAAAAIFFIFMFSSVFSTWNQDGKLVVSKQENLIIEGDTVIVPKGVTVKGDLLVKNGKLKIEGTVDGDVTLVKSKLITDKVKGEGLMASAGEVSGEMKQVNQAFEWIWYNLKSTVKSIFSLDFIWIVG